MSYSCEPENVDSRREMDQSNDVQSDIEVGTVFLDAFFQMRFLFSSNFFSQWCSSSFNTPQAFRVLSSFLGSSRALSSFLRFLRVFWATLKFSRIFSNHLERRRFSRAQVAPRQACAAFWSAPVTRTRKNLYNPSCFIKFFGVL